MDGSRTKKEKWIAELRNAAVAVVLIIVIALAVSLTGTVPKEDMPLVMQILISLYSMIAFMRGALSSDLEIMQIDTFICWMFLIASGSSKVLMKAFIG